MEDPARRISFVALKGITHEQRPLDDWTPKLIVISCHSGQRVLLAFGTSGSSFSPSA
jgi:hypothetical protein